jgi:hypothetical protein
MNVLTEETPLRDFRSLALGGFNPRVGRRAFFMSIFGDRRNVSTEVAIPKTTNSQYPPLSPGQRVKMMSARRCACGPAQLRIPLANLSHGWRGPNR